MANERKDSKQDKLPVAPAEDSFLRAMSPSEQVDQRARMKSWKGLEERSTELISKVISDRSAIVERAAEKWDKFIKEDAATADPGAPVPGQAANSSRLSATEQSAASGAQRSSMMEEAKLLQSEQQELQTLTINAMASVLIDPEGAYTALQLALRRSTGWVERMIDWQRRSLSQGTAPLLASIGQAACLLGKLEEARQAFEQAASFSVDASSQAFLFESLGQIELMQGSFSAADEHFDQAHRRYVESQQWEYAARTFNARAQCAHERGDRGGFWRRLDDAIGFSKEHSLADWERKLQLAKLRFQLISETADEPLEKLIAYYNQREALHLDAVEVEELAADYWTARGARDPAIKHLRKAEDRARIEAAAETPERTIARAQERAGTSADTRSWIHTRCRILQKLSDLYSFSENPTDQDIENAIQYAAESSRIAKELKQPILIRPSLSSLVRSLSASGRTENCERAEQSLDELRNLGPSDELVHALLARAEAEFKQQHCDLALQAITQAEQCASALTNLDLRRLVLIARTAVLGTAGSLAEALDANQRALALFNEQYVPIGKPTVIESSGWLHGIDTLSGNAAMLLARSGRIKEAFEYAENGKARRLRAELAHVGLTDGKDQVGSTSVGLAELRTTMSAENAAMAVYWSGLEKTLILIITPDCEQPKEVLIDLSANELKALIPTAKAGEDEPWAGRELQALSQKLVPLALQEVIQDSRLSVLYLVLDARLDRVPFAALPLRDGSPLIKHCGLACVPSAGIMKWCLSRTFKDNQRRYLVVGIGRENKASFADQAAEVSHLIGRDAQLLPEAEASTERFWELAPQFTVLHLSCHGYLDTLMPTPLLASRLEFKGESLSAKEVFEHQGQLKADLVFLNACRSGLFNTRRGSEIGGFWEGFLHAGAASIIATLRFVHPDYAHRLALKFYDAWTKEGATKAEALRRAQFAMYQAGVEPRHWASHVLVGAHR
jgi:CHAT domain-containing protein